MAAGYTPEYDDFEPPRLALDDGRKRPAPLPDLQWPTAAEVVAALNEAGLHGSAWFDISGLSLADDEDDYDDGFCLGEVTLGGPGRRRPTRAGDPVCDIGLRKPRASTLRATLALLPLLGPLVVFDDYDSESLLVRPDDDPAALAAVWPWD
jgi:hypothetical protein